MLPEMRWIEIRIDCPRCHKKNKCVLAPGADGRPVCGSCKAPLFDYAIITGFVYVLSNPGMPGLVKIGCTSKSVEERVKELNSATGVPFPFAIEAFFAADQPAMSEKLVHEALADFRVEGKEFFRIAAADAIRRVRKVLGRPPSLVRHE